MTSTLPPKQSSVFSAVAELVPGDGADRLNSSSPLNQINNQHDDCNYEQKVDQTAPNMTNEAEQPEHDQDDNYSPEHG
jgi:hypothetical protein